MCWFTRCFQTITMFTAKNVQLLFDKFILSFLSNLPCSCLIAYTCSPVHILEHLYRGSELISAEKPSVSSLLPWREWMSVWVGLRAGVCECVSLRVNVCVSVWVCGCICVWVSARAWRENMCVGAFPKLWISDTGNWSSHAEREASKFSCGEKCSMGEMSWMGSSTSRRRSCSPTPSPSIPNIILQFIVATVASLSSSSTRTNNSPEQNSLQIKTCSCWRLAFRIWSVLMLNLVFFFWLLSLKWFFKPPKNCKVNVVANYYL